MRPGLLLLAWCRGEGGRHVSEARDKAQAVRSLALAVAALDRAQDKADLGERGAAARTLLVEKAGWLIGTENPRVSRSAFLLLVLDAAADSVPFDQEDDDYNGRTCDECGAMLVAPEVERCQFCEQYA